MDNAINENASLKADESAGFILDLKGKMLKHRIIGNSDQKWDFPVHLNYEGGFSPLVEIQIGDKVFPLSPGDTQLKGVGRFVVIIANGPGFKVSLDPYNQGGLPYSDIWIGPSGLFRATAYDAGKSKLDLSVNTSLEVKDGFPAIEVLVENVSKGAVPVGKAEIYKGHLHQLVFQVASTSGNGRADLSWGIRAV